MSIRQDLGKVSVTPKGTWSSATAYERLDVVTYNGGSYLSVQDVPIGTAITNTDYWQLVAEKGETGATGAQGAQGETGATGATPDISATATVDSNIGTPSVSVVKTGTTENPSFAFNFSNLKGAKGDPGTGGDNWRTIVDTILTEDTQDLAINKDSNNQSFTLKQFRIYVYAPQQTGSAQTNGYLYLKIVGQDSPTYIGFGTLNFISTSADNYWLIEVMPPNTFPACAKFAVNRPSTSTANIQMMFEKNGHAANNYTQIFFALNGSARFLSGAHIIIEGVDA